MGDYESGGYGGEGGRERSPSPQRRPKSDEFKLYIGNLSYRTQEDSLRAAFESFGQVTFCRIMENRETGQSRGFGFVSYGTKEEADEAISKMDGQDLDGRNIRVNFARPREEGGGGGGYRGGGGGYGGGGYGGGGGGYGRGGYGGGGGHGGGGGGGYRSRDGGYGDRGGGGGGW